MTRQKLIVAAYLAASLAQANVRILSPTTLLQDKPDPRLAASIKEYFTLVGKDKTKDKEFPVTPKDNDKEDKEVT
jgi:hypothetical protein